MGYRSDFFIVHIDKKFYPFRVYQRTKFSKFRLTYYSSKIVTFEDIHELIAYTNDLFLENDIDSKIYGSLFEQLYDFYYDEHDFQKKDLYEENHKQGVCPACIISST